MSEINWPLVAPNDDGIRPAGPPDECFYCHQKVGKPHGRECVTVTKLVRITYTVQVDTRVPHSWDEDATRFHRTESSWCADNMLGEIEAHAAEEEGDECLCGRVGVSAVEVLDPTPSRDLCAEEVISRIQEADSE